MSLNIPNLTNPLACVLTSNVWGNTTIIYSGEKKSPAKEKLVLMDQPRGFEIHPPTSVAEPTGLKANQLLKPRQEN